MSKSRGNKGMSNKRGLIGLNSLNAIPVENIEELRRGVFNVVKGNLPRAKEVLAGTRKWDPQQVRLYLAFLNKVMPELSASYNETHSSSSIDDMTPDQLRAIIAKETARINTLPDATPLDSSPILEADPEPQYRASPIFEDTNVQSE